ncbi:MAG: hypothetical protein GY803_11650 [Chloroflexi bacterium]|nr:hypothetical protein [Chloroflexota bacterium]
MWTRIVPIETRLARGEDQTQEFKASARIPALARAVCGFANADRKGVVWVGVADDGQLLGIESQVRKFSSRRAFARWLKRELCAAIEPGPFVRVRTRRVQGVLLGQVAVSPRRLRLPPRRPLQHKGKVYIRRGRSTMRLNAAGARDLHHKLAWRRFWAWSGNLLLAFLLMILIGPPALAAQWGDYYAGQEKLVEMDISLFLAQPKFSAQGDAVFFEYLKLPESPGRDIYRLDLQTGALAPIVTSRFYEGSPSPSPDGQWVLFDRDIPEEGWQIRRVHLETGDEEQVLAREGYSVSQPVMSADGSFMVFVAWNEEAGGVFRMFFPDGAWEQLNPPGTRHCREADLSRDMLWVVMQCDDDAALPGMRGTGDIWRISLATKKAIRLTDAPGADLYPIFTPDNDIVFQTARNGVQELMVMNLDGSETRLLSFFGDAYPAISPDGKRLLFMSFLRDLHSTPYIMDFDADALVGTPFFYPVYRIWMVNVGAFFVDTFESFD